MNGWQLTVNDSLRFVKNTASFDVTTRGHRAKGVPVYAMKAYRWSRGIAPLILSLCTTWNRVVNFTPRLLDFQEITPLPIEWEGWWAPQPAWRFWREVSCPLRDSNPASYIYLYYCVCVCVCARAEHRGHVGNLDPLNYTARLRRTQPYAAASYRQIREALPAANWER
jgi:hypothetical protein